MSTNIFQDYRQLMIQLGREEPLTKEETRYQEIMQAMRDAVGSFDIPDSSRAADTLRSMLKSPTYSEAYENFPGEHEAAKWFKSRYVFGARAADEALNHWGPSADVKQGLIDERDWVAHMAEGVLDMLRYEVKTEEQKVVAVLEIALGANAPSG